MKIKQSIKKFIPEFALKRYRKAKAKSLESPVIEGLTNRTFQDIAGEFDSMGLQAIYCLGDRSFHEGAKDQFRNLQLSFGSLLYSPLSDPTKVDFSQFDAFVVGGRDFPTSYTYILRALAKSNLSKPVYCVGSGLQFCGSTIPIPSQATDADIYLYNHFEAFFAVKDPLLVKVKILSGDKAKVEYRILKPFETLNLKLSEWLPGRSGPSVLMIECVHPVLTRGRHNRWRMWADVHYGNSFTSLHGAHDYGPARDTQSRIHILSLDEADLAITIPNYYRTKDFSKSVESHEAGSVENTPVLDTPVSEIIMHKKRGTSDYFGYRYTGYGTSYQFFLKNRERPNIAGNHESTISIAEMEIENGDKPLSYYSSLAQDGFILHPFALPLLDSGVPFEFGFSFLAANPRIKKFKMYEFDSSGQRLNTRPIEVSKGLVTFSSEFAENCKGSIVIVEPDWEAEGISPTALRMTGDLVVRHKKSNDSDHTEFQNCWRNIGVLLNDFPHWIHPRNAVIARTNLVGRVRCDSGYRTGIMLANASGKMTYNRTAHFTLTVSDRNGRRISFSQQIGPFSSRLLWFDEVFPDLGHHLKDGYGGLAVVSDDADINCQVVTLSQDGSVGLQHLWGY